MGFGSKGGLLLKYFFALVIFLFRKNAFLIIWAPFKMPFLSFLCRVRAVYAFVAGPRNQDFDPCNPDSGPRNPDFDPEIRILAARRF